MQKKQFFKILTLSITSILLINFFSSCNLHKKHTLRVGSNIWIGYEPLFLARELGYLDEEIIQMVEYRSTSEVLDALENNLIESACVTLSELIAHNMKTTSTTMAKAIVILDTSHGGDAIISRNFGKLDEIEGKKIGLEDSPLGNYILSRVLEKTKLTEDKIHKVYAPVSKHYDMIVREQVDALITFEPVRSRLIYKGGYVEVFTSKDIPGEIIDLLTINGSKIDTYKENIEHLKQAWQKAVKYIEEHPLDASRIMSKRLGISTKETLDSFNLIEIPTLEKSNVMLDINNAETEKLVKRKSKFISGKNKRVVTLNDLIIREEK